MAAHLKKAVGRIEILETKILEDLDEIVMQSIHLAESSRWRIV
jgi:hypothetical protein